MVPYHLAICEDSSLIREEVCGFCEDILTDHKITYDISSFSSAKDLEAVLNKKKDAFDLLILDIEMDEMTGMELAKKLRAGHNRVSIIFMTGYEDYLLEGYTVQPIYFLLKPVSKEKLESALCLDWEINHTRQTVVLKKGSRTLSLSLPDIIYMEAGENHSIKIFQRDREIHFPSSLRYMEEVLPRERFARCHNSYIVNLEHVREIKKTRLHLDDGDWLPIGRKFYKDFQHELVGFLNRLQ